MLYPKENWSAAAKTSAMLFVAFGLIAGCASAPQSAASDTTDAAPTNQIKSESSEMPASPWNITFADGSANTFRFWQDVSTEAAQYKYEPVTMAESSSGTYSGGTAKAGELSPEETETIWTHVDTLSADEALHTDNRMMGTGSFMVNSSGAEREFIVKTGPELQKFMTLLEQFRGK
jgi:hypothetical protein